MYIFIYVLLYQEFVHEGEEYSLKEKTVFIAADTHTFFSLSKSLAGSVLREVLGSDACVLIDRDDNDAPSSAEILHTVWQRAWKGITEGDNNEDQQEDIFQTEKLGRCYLSDGTGWTLDPGGWHPSLIENPAELDTLESRIDFFLCLFFILAKEIEKYS